MTSSLACVAVLVACLSGAFGLPNGLGLTPQMGWNSWNHFACNVNQDVIMQTIDYLVSTGLKDVGYNYVVMRSCLLN